MMNSLSVIGFHVKLVKDLSFMSWLMSGQKRIKWMDETTNIWVIQALQWLLYNSSCKKERNKTEAR